VVSVQSHQRNGEEPTPDASETDQTFLDSRVPEYEGEDSDHDEREPTEPTDLVAGHDDKPTTMSIKKIGRKIATTPRAAVMQVDLNGSV
jgi:hypothetical protein